jgi:hypothetical protein
MRTKSAQRIKGNAHDDPDLRKLLNIAELMAIAPDIGNLAPSSLIKFRAHEW